MYVSIKKSKYEDAADRFVRTLKLNPEHGAALNNLGAIAILQEQFNKAKDYLLRTLDLHPNYIDVAHNLKLLKDNKYNF